MAEKTAPWGWSRPLEARQQQGTGALMAVLSRDSVCRAAGHTLTAVFAAPEGGSNLCHLAAGSLKSRPD